tara:strand:+ start:265 stop:1272 length:1008 start_codon:yes stop_codon:yes gene_type:complete
MKVLAIGDPHFKTSNIKEVDMFLERIESLCIQETPDLIIILGDLLHEHERLHTTPLNKAYHFVKQMSKITLTYVIVGNHDLINNQQFLTQNHWMNAMKDWPNVVVVDDVMEYNNEFLLCPYVPPGRFIEAISKFENWREYKAIFCHQEFYGCKMGAIISSDGDKWDKKHPDIISGHIHSNQTLDNVYYPGSSMQHAFGESEKNVIPVFTWNQEDKYDLKEIDLDLPRKKIVYKDVDDLDSLEIKPTIDKVKISLHGNYEQFKVFKKSKKYKDLIEKGIVIVYKYDKKKIDNESYKDCDFMDVLNDIVEKEKNAYLISDYNYVVHNKQKNEEILLI